MSAAEDDSDKSFEPSQKKLDDARKKGEIARSADLSVAAGYGGMLLAVLFAGHMVAAEVGGILSDIFDRADTWGSLFLDGQGSEGGAFMAALALAVSPIFVVPAVAVIAVLIAQRAIIVAPDKIRPKLSRISILSNAKQKFGRTGLFEFAKSSVKLTIYATLLFVLLRARFEDMATSLAMQPSHGFGILTRICVEFLLVVFAVALAIGGVDYLWQWHEHRRKNRMSHKEMRDEHKEAEGDPQFKQTRRQRAQEIAARRMMQDVPGADVIIVNPTHYAVALKWDRSPGTAPVCVAKGVDEIARRIREIAMENGVPIHSDPPTARALFASTEIGQEISTDAYRAVAAAIRFADGLRAKKRFRVT